MSFHIHRCTKLFTFGTILHRYIIHTFLYLKIVWVVKLVELMAGDLGVEVVVQEGLERLVCFILNLYIYSH